MNIDENVMMQPIIMYHLLIYNYILLEKRREVGANVHLRYFRLIRYVIEIIFSL